MKYADVLDRASELAEEERTYAVVNMKRYAQPKPNGTCKWCNKEVELPKLFCDSKCAKRWSFENEGLR